MRRRTAGATALLALALVVAGCASGLSAEGEALTVEQSEQLAQTRFRMLAEGEFVAHVSVAADEDVRHVEAELTVDPDAHAAWGTVRRGPADLATEQSVALTPAGLALEEGGSWRAQPWTGSDLTGLAVVFSLSADRPENAQLLRQSDARYLGSEDVDGESLRVFRLPGEDGATGESRLWLDESGELRRLDGGEGGAFRIDLPDAGTTPRPAIVDDLLAAGGSGG